MFVTWLFYLLRKNQLMVKKHSKLIYRLRTLAGLRCNISGMDKKTVVLSPREVYMICQIIEKSSTKPPKPTIPTISDTIKLKLNNKTITYKRT